LCPLTKRDVQRCTENEWTLMFSEISRAAAILGETDQCSLQLLFESPSPTSPKTSRRRVPGPPASNESPDRVDDRVDVDGGTIYTANSVPPPPEINGRISME
jgi:hypothetical protein